MAPTLRRTADDRETRSRPPQVRVGPLCTYPDPVDPERATCIALDAEHGGVAPFAVLDALAEVARAAYIVEMDHFIHEKYDFRLLRSSARTARRRSRSSVR